MGLFFEICEKIPEVRYLGLIHPYVNLHLYSCFSALLKIRIFLDLCKDEIISERSHIPIGPRRIVSWS